MAKVWLKVCKNKTKNKHTKNKTTTTNTKLKPDSVSCVYKKITSKLQLGIIIVISLA